MTDLSDFWVRKMMTHFTRLDADGDGVVTEEDFDTIAERFIEVGGLDNQGAEVLRSNLNAIWRNYWNAADTNRDGQVTGDEFVTSMTHVVSSPELREKVGGPLPLFFKAIDANSDGMISATDYENFFKCIRIDPSLAEESFNAIDSDGDGVLSEDEFVAAGEEFFLSEDMHAPTQNYWGPLVD